MLCREGANIIGSRNQSVCEAKLTVGPKAGDWGRELRPGLPIPLSS